MAALRDPEIKELTEVLLNAFDKGSLTLTVRNSLGMNLERIAYGGNLEEEVSNLIAWAKLKGKTKALMRGAFVDNPENPDLIKFVLTYDDWLSSPEPALPLPRPPDHIG